MPALTPHAAAQLAMMADRGMGVERMAAGLGLSPAAVEAELRWRGLAAGKASGRGGQGYYHAVEVGLGDGGWLQRRRRFALEDEARAEAEEVRRGGGTSRVVRIADDGTREVVG